MVAATVVTLTEAMTTAVCAYGGQQAVADSDARH